MKRRLAQVFLPVILAFGILSLWVRGRWAVGLFETALYVLLMAVLIRRETLRVPPIGWMVAGAPVWGLLQIAFGWTVYTWATAQAVLDWTAILAGFAVALFAFQKRRARGLFLRGTLVFSLLLAVVSTFQLFTAPGRAFWLWDTGFTENVLGPFVYRNQYAAFIEAVLPLALVGALMDRRHSVAHIGAAAALFASVIAGASRTGVILCGVEIVTIPLIAWRRSLAAGRSLAKVAVWTVLAAAVFTGVVGWEKVWDRLQEPNPYTLRWDLTRSSIEMAQARPMIGFGLGTWSTAYPGYARFDDGLFVNQAHNDWVQWAAEGGVPFLLLMVAVVVFTARPASRSLWGLGLIAVFVHCLVDYPMQQRPALAVFFFALLGVLMAEHQESDGVSPHPEGTVRTGRT